MDENMNNGQNNQTNFQNGGQMYGQPNMYQQNGQQMYGQPDMSQQTYQQNGQQMYGQPDMSQQMYQQNGQQMYGQPDMSQQTYQQNGQQMYGQPDMSQQMYQQNGQQMYQNQPQSGKSSKLKFDMAGLKNVIDNNKNLIIMGAVALVALILIISILRGFLGHGKQSPKSVAKAYTEAFEDNKPKKYYKLYDKKFIKYMEDELDQDKDDIMKSIERDIDDFYDEMDYSDVGKVKKIKCKITDVDKEKGKSFKEGKKKIKKEMGISISAAAEVEMDWEIKGSDKDIEYKASVSVYKRMGKWYLIYGMNYEK